MREAWPFGNPRCGGKMAMNLSATSQIMKQKEMRDERKRSGPGVTAPGRAAQKLIPLLLETKWKAPAPRSAQCEGCGPGKWTPAGAPSSRAWKCGPCARALEEAYMTRLERQEKLHIQREGEMVQLGVDNIALEEDKQRSAVQIDRLRVLLFENEGRQVYPNRYRGTSLMRNTPLPGPFSRTIPRVLQWS